MSTDIENTPADGLEANGSDAKQQLSPFRALVAKHDKALRRAHDNNELSAFHYRMGDAVAFRHDSPGWVRRARRHSWFGLAGLLAGLGVLAGVLYVLPTPSAENDGVDWFAGCLAGLVTWVTITAVVGEKFIRPHVLPLTSNTTAGLYDALNDGRREIITATERGDSRGEELLAAVDALLPGFEELVDEYQRLLSASKSNSGYYHRTKYSEALNDAIADVACTMIGVVAEVNAVAEVLFLSRDDLLVKVAQVGAEVDPLDIDVRRLSEEAQAQLAQARTALVDAGERLL